MEQLRFEKKTFFAGTTPAGTGVVPAGVAHNISISPFILSRHLFQQVSHVQHLDLSLYPQQACSEKLNHQKQALLKLPGIGFFSSQESNQQYFWSDVLVTSNRMICMGCAHDRMLDVEFWSNSTLQKHCRIDAKLPYLR